MSEALGRSATVAAVLAGHLDELVEPTIAHFQAERLKEELAKA